MCRYKKHLPPNMILSEVYSSYENCVSYMNTASIKCLMTEFQDVIEELYTLRPVIRGYRPAHNHCQDILYPAKGTSPDRKFVVTSERTTCCEDPVHLRLAATSMLKLITKLKEELTFREDYISKQGRQLLFQTRGLTNHLETKLHGFLEELEKSVHKSCNGCSAVECRDEFMSVTTCNTEEYVMNHLNNVFGKKAFPVYLNSHSESGNSFDENCNSYVHQKVTHNTSKYVESPCYDKPYSHPLQYSSHVESQRIKNQFLNSSSLKRCVRRLSPTTKIEDSSIFRNKGGGLNWKGMKQFKLQQPPKIHYGLSHVARKDQHYMTIRTSKSETLSLWKGSKTDNDQGKPRLKRNKRNRTRAGDDNVRRYRSCSNNVRMNNANCIRALRKRRTKDNHMSGIRSKTTNYNSNTSKFNRSSKAYHTVNSTNTYYNNKSNTFWNGSNYQSQDSLKQTLRIYLTPRKTTNLYHQNDARLAGGANRGIFRIHKSISRNQNLNRVTKKREDNYTRIRKMPFRIYSSKPSKRKGIRKVTFSPRSKIVHVPRKDRRFITDGRSKMRISDDCVSQCSSFVGFEFDECCCCPPPTRMSGCQCVECTDYCCLPRDYCNYQPIPYPMCSNTCCSVVSLVQPEQYFIEFDEPRRRKIVKRYVRVEKNLLSTPSLEDTESQSFSEPHLTSRPLKKRKLIKLRKESREIIYGYDSPASCETEPNVQKTSSTMTISQGTSTDHVSTVDTGTSTYNIIEAVKAIGTNTSESSTRDFGVNTIIQERQPSLRPIQTASKHTNTDKVRSRTVGTDARPIPGSYAIEKQIPGIYAEEKHTAKRIDIIKPHYDETDPIMRGSLDNIQTERGIIVTHPDKSQQVVRSQRTIPHALQTLQTDQNTRGMVVTHSEPSEQVISSQRTKPRTLQTLETDQNTRGIVVTDPETSQQVVSSQRTKPHALKTLQNDKHTRGIVTTEPETSQQVVKNQRTKPHALQTLQTDQNTRGIVVTDPETSQQVLSSQRTKPNALQTLQTDQNTRGIIVTHSEPSQQVVSSQRTKPHALQTLQNDKHPRGIVTTEPSQQVVRNQRTKPHALQTLQTDQHTRVHRQQLDIGQPKTRGQELKTPHPNQEFTQHLTPKQEGDLQILTKQPVDYTQMTSKQPVEPNQVLSKDPLAHVQNISRPQAKYFQSKRPQHTLNRQILDHQNLEYISTNEQGPRKEHTYISPNKRQRGVLTDNRQEYVLMKDGRKSLITKTRPESLLMSNKPSILTENNFPFEEPSSELSVYVKLEKIHEEIFRKRCRICKCVNKCICKCCGKGFVSDEKLIVCEKKRSNTFRITNKSNHSIDSKEREVTNYVDTNLEFNIPRSRSNIFFNYNL